MQAQSNQDTGGRQQRQHNTLQLALTKLQEHTLTVEQVRRVAVERTGVIHIEVHVAGSQRFFVYEANELRELWPQNDSKIPLAAKLADDEFAAGHTIISYRPGRRIVLGPVAGEQGHIIKGFRRRRAAHTAELYGIVTSICRQTGFHVPELLQYKQDSDCLVMALQPGQPPGINEGEAEAWNKIGASLRQFQQSPRNAGLIADLQKFGPLDELAVLDERARRFLMCVPALPGQWVSGRRQLDMAAKNLPPAVNGPAHRDLHDGQFIVSGKTISLLDFDLVCIADVALDAANLLAHMRLRTLQDHKAADGAGLSVCSDAFSAGLGRQDEAGFEQRLLFYQATSYYRLALLYALRPRWVHLTEVLVNSGRRCLEAFNDAQGGS